MTTFFLPPDFEDILNYCLKIGDHFIVPIPYPVTHKMSQSKNCSKNVFINRNPAFLHGASFVDKVKGDSPGNKHGVVSQVHGQVSFSQKKSDSVFINKQPVVRTGDRVGMNAKKP